MNRFLKEDDQLLLDAHLNRFYVQKHEMGFFFCGNIVILHYRFDTRINNNNDIFEQHFQTQNRSMVVAMAKALVIRYPDNSE